MLMVMVMVVETEVLSVVLRCIKDTEVSKSKS